VSRRWLTVWPPPLSPAVYARAGRSIGPYPLGDPDARLFAWGRQALWHGVRAVGLLPGDTVLVPAYHHGSEVEALLQEALLRELEGRLGESRLDAAVARVADRAIDFRPALIQ